ncbi:MAG: PAS domain S-box protein [Methylacidiphilales bacterium]|nr:PAS domain S-box protein [Candidatus Methylacidiphilales bacterium]
MDAIITVDSSERITIFNHAAERMFGCPAKEAIGTKLNRFVPSRFREGHSEHIKKFGEMKQMPRAMGGLRSVSGLRVNGEEFPVEASISHYEADGEKSFTVILREISERVKADATIRRFATIVQNSEDAIISKTLEGVITSWNPAAERMFGYTGAEAIGQPITLIFPPEQYDEETELLAKIGRGEFVHHYETVRVRKDGTKLNVSATISPLKDGTGKIIGASKILRDITEQKKAEEQLRLLRSCIANINDIVVVVEAEPLRGKGPKIVFVNEALERLTGYTPSETIGTHVHSFLSSGKTDPKIHDEIRAALAKRKPIRRQIYSQGLNGKEYCMDVEISPVYDAKGRCTHFVGIHRDVTEFKRILQQTQEQAALLNQTQDAILVRDLGGRILFWNKAAERIYGWTVEEALGNNVAELVNLDLVKFQEANATVIELGEWSGELRHISKNRRELIIEARWSVLRDSEGNPTSVLAVNTDVTEKRKIETQFMRAQRMESIGILAGGIAHDLNNILAPIVLSLDMLKERLSDPESKLILETIEMSARRGTEIVRQVLSFARGMDGDRIEIQPKYLMKDLERIVKDTFPKDIRLQLILPEQSWTVRGDPTQIHQILLNLCVNARDAMQNGGALTVSADNRVLDEQYVAMNIDAKAGPYVVLSVTDSGCGIPPENLEKIFEPFFTTKEIGKGTGLGLSTVMAIVKSHHGFINVYSEPNVGTTFKIYLPAASTVTESGEDVSLVADLPRGNGETVLIVDDEAAILVITGQTLEAFGYRILKAGNGAEAVAIYAQHQKEIDVVLTDMAMPVMDGAATIYALLRINPNLKIIAASGLYANGGVMKATNAGVKHFITKPYTASILLATLRDILQESRMDK